MHLCLSHSLLHSCRKNDSRTNLLMCQGNVSIPVLFSFLLMLSSFFSLLKCLPFSNFLKESLFLSFHSSFSSPLTFHFSLFTHFITWGTVSITKYISSSSWFKKLLFIFQSKAITASSNEGTGEHTRTQSNSHWSRDSPGFGWVSCTGSLSNLTIPSLLGSAQHTQGTQQNWNRKM